MEAMDSWVGFVSKAFGVSVHRYAPPTVPEPAWNGYVTSVSFVGAIQVHGGLLGLRVEQLLRTVGLLAEVANVISDRSPTSTPFENDFTDIRSGVPSIR